MEKYTHAVASCKFCDVEGSKYLLGIPFLKYLCAEVFNNEPCAKEAYEEMAAKINSENEAVYYATMNQITAKNLLYTAAGLIGDYIICLLKRRFGHKVASYDLWCCLTPVAIYADYLRCLGEECLKLNFDFSADGTIPDKVFEDTCSNNLWWHITRKTL